MIVTLVGTSTASGDALLVAVSGGFGTMVGGIVAATVAWRSKKLEMEAASSASKAEARRRQAERGIVSARASLEALQFYWAAVDLAHGRRPTPSDLPEAALRAEASSRLVPLRNHITTLCMPHLAELLSAAVASTSGLFRLRDEGAIEAQRHTAEADLQALQSAIAGALQSFEVAATA